MAEMQLTYASVRLVALNMLAVREHSKKELVSKLMTKFDAPDLIQEVLFSLVEVGLQSDERFAEAFVRLRVRQGKGPVLIGLELAQKGITSELIQRFTSADVIDWNALAAEVCKKKFGLEKSITPKNRSKQARFMASRGFGHSHILFALDNQRDLEN